MSDPERITQGIESPEHRGRKLGGIALVLTGVTAVIGTGMAAGTSAYQREHPQNSDYVPTVDARPELSDTFSVGCWNAEHGYKLRHNITTLYGLQTPLIVGYQEMRSDNVTSMKRLRPDQYGTYRAEDGWVTMSGPLSLFDPQPYHYGNLINSYFKPKAVADRRLSRDISAATSLGAAYKEYRGTAAATYIVPLASGKVRLRFVVAHESGDHPISNTQWRETTDFLDEDYKFHDGKNTLTLLCIDGNANPQAMRKKLGPSWIVPNIGWTNIENSGHSKGKKVEKDAIAIRMPENVTSSTPLVLGESVERSVMSDHAAVVLQLGNSIVSRQFVTNVRAFYRTRTVAPILQKK